MKDELNDDGTVKKPATIDMFTLAGAKSSIGATISQNVQQSFAGSVSWKRVADAESDDTTSPDNEPDDTTGGGDQQQGGGGNSSITPGEGD